ncbi:unnamed protein product [Bursaphelenchus okinawaensis]|uniref:Uncharacterized protein n=1 Tax=Bursaphelenchus okinawaensis TaxID=465554 RepID=A0A811KW35_9BILA|nr:unnamed protein product [Bursaphelenchus okinawaensis]CAG9112862.1 unnamed protein product [Bursaphelenchus okinawaensis]
MFGLKVLLALIGALALFGGAVEARRYFDSYDDDWRPRTARAAPPMSAAVRRRFVAELVDIDPDASSESTKTSSDQSSLSSRQEDDSSSGLRQREGGRFVLVDEVGERYRNPEPQVVLVQRPEESYAERPPVYPEPTRTIFVRPTPPPPPPPQPEYKFVVERPKVRVVDDGSYRTAPPRFATVNVGPSDYEDYPYESRIPRFRPKNALSSRNFLIIP